jgi:hypothetical protein
LYWNLDNAATYAAYFKAVALGLQAGARAAAAASAAGPRDWRGRPAAPDLPLVLPGALALTPGPYLEELAANDFLSYLDGFNWHFYGYDGDFTAQYHQFETALGELAAARRAATGGGPTVDKSLPVFLSEYGYGQLGGTAAPTIAGRVRQWRWFQSVTTQMRALGVAGPVAFYLSPYLERNFSEFGLTMRPAGLHFTPADFGADKPASWMAGIGAPVGANVASPALAWLAAQPAPRRSQDWTVKVPAPSPIVIDFLPDDSLLTLKSWHGLLVQSGTGPVHPGGGELRIYNFSDETLTGRLTMAAAPGLVPDPLPAGGVLTLAPWALVRVPVSFQLTAGDLRGFAWTAGFAESRGRVPSSVYATTLYPNAAAMARETTYRFDDPKAALAAAVTAAGNRRLLLDRPLAAEEPHLQPWGRWLVSDGVAVDETALGWRFTVTALPPQPLRPAMAELPLPDDFVLPEANLLWFDYQLTAAPTAMPAVEFDCYFRTANGNLFEVPMRLTATSAWQNFAEAKENFTGMSYGRMNPPWRFADNRPVALVFFLRPKALPVTMMIRDVELTRFHQQ